MKVLSIVTLIILSLSLVACDNTLLDKSSKETYIAPSFEVDELTVRQNNEWNIKQEIAEETEEYTVKTEADIKVDVGEIQLENTDGSVDYIVEGEDIVYNGVRFKGLNTALNSVASPYDINTFINFVVKTYSTTEANVNVTYSIDSENSSDDGEGVGAYIGLHESLMADSTDYQYIYNKYGVEVDWQILLDSGKNEEFGMLYGCNDYVMYQGVGNLVIDMNKFDSGAPEVVTETQVDEVESEEPVSEEN